MNIVALGTIPKTLVSQSQYVVELNDVLIHIQVDVTHLFERNFRYSQFSMGGNGFVPKLFTLHHSHFHTFSLTSQIQGPPSFDTTGIFRQNKNNMKSFGTNSPLPVGKWLNCLVAALNELNNFNDEVT